MSIRHPGCAKLENPISGLRSRILWRLMPRATRQALKDVAAENATLVKQQSDQQRHFIESRRSICDLSDRHEERAKDLQAQLEHAEATLMSLDQAHHEALTQIKHLDELALPGFTDLVKTAIP